MKLVRISDVMWPYIKTVLIRDGYTNIRTLTVNDGSYLDIDGISNRRFSEIMEDAQCEKQRCEGNPDIPVYSYRTLKNRAKRNRLFRINKRHGFHVLIKDMERCKKEKLI